MAKILVAGLNPAWQRILSFSAWIPGTVNRARAARGLASGKGINAAKALAKLGHEVAVLQILAGGHGRRCLEDCERWGIKSLHVQVEGETRACTTLLSDSGETTELIEPFSVGEHDVENRLLRLLPNDSAFDGLAVCGSLPSGLHESFYGRLLERVTASRVVWDSAMGLTSGLLRRLSWIKVNAREFEDLKTVWDGAWPEKDQPALLLTRGADAARVRNSRDADGDYPIPHPEKIRNPIGAGDTVSAGLLDGLLRGLSAQDAVRHALALGAASCADALPAEWDPGLAAELLTKIRRVA